ncbi:MAG: ferrous iron transport protein A [Clostridiales bacterium]|nr:ferrous iron transport protein A [Clostridiales bacterium]
MEKRLSDLRTGQGGIIKKLEAAGAAGERLEELGFTRGSFVEAAHRSLFGDIAAYSLCGEVFAVREETAEGIVVETGG